MDPPAARLAAWLASHRVDAEHLTFEESTHSVAQAARAVGAEEAAFVKSICLIAGDDLCVAIVKGEDRASTSRVAAALGRPDRPRLATPEEMLDRTGYPAGGTPPFGFPATFLVDEKVLERSHVYAGGGSDQALVCVAPREMMRANGGRVARVRK